MDYEFSHVEKLAPRSRRIWPLSLAGALLLLAFAGAAIFIIRTSMAIQEDIARGAGWLTGLEDERALLKAPAPGRDAGTDPLQGIGRWSPG
ncbi:MAG: hypothetical protein FJ098_05270 [Deltaproteobacteria bacterium]|nr:hypothetical protein [Deltaproteobacteria bacterium]